MYKVIGPDGLQYASDQPGTLGGHCRLKIYGRLDCKSALSWIARGHYVKYRVFFIDESAAVAAGYRPCSVCMPDEFDTWKALETQLAK